MATTNDPPKDLPSILGQTLRFKGELRAEEDLMIKGRIEGSITHSQRLTICREGHVKGDIEGQVIIVEGTVEGDLTAAVSVAVMAGSSVTGDVRAPSVSIVEGANFNGNVFMEPNKSVRALRPVESPTLPALAVAGAVGAAPVRAPFGL
jgi:cytoskeletal protein CcmA (bactofilin family)